MHKSALFLIGAALAAAEVHTVDVGESGLSFSPQTLSVKTGDTVIFHLYPRHNVITGPFSSPCKPDSGNGGFYSGPFSDTNNGAKKFVVNVTSEDAVYYYCGVQNHCQGGMVGGWNLPSSGDTANAYASAAKSATPATPSSLKGGQLLDDSAVASLTASGSSPSTSSTASGSGSAASSRSVSTTPVSSRSGTPTASGTGASTSPTSSNVANAKGEVGGALALVLGAAAYFL